MDYFKLCDILSELPSEFLFGVAHVVFEDGNLDNETIDACLKRFDGKVDSEYIQLNTVLLQLLKAIPEELRERPEDKETDA